MDYEDDVSLYNDELNNNLVDEIRLQGIMVKGYGILPKLVMIDHNLSIEAKSLYAFFCSFSGCGNVSFPGREYIINFLNIGKETYYNALNELKNKGLLQVTRQIRQKGQFARNIYTLVSNPEEYISTASSDLNEINTLSINNLLRCGYGFIPKAVMIDKKLNAKVKALYAYICVYTGAGQTAFPKKQYILHHLNISDATYRRLLNVLVKANYIEIIPIREKGKFIGNRYEVVDKPNLTPENGKLSPQAQMPDVVQPDVVEPDMVPPDVVKQDTNNNKVNNNRINKNKDNRVIIIENGISEEEAILDENDTYSIFEDDRFCLDENCSMDLILKDTEAMRNFTDYTRNNLSDITYFRFRDIADFYMIESEVDRPKEIIEKSIDLYVSVLLTFSDAKIIKAVRKFSSNDLRYILGTIISYYLKEPTTENIYDIRGYIAKTIMNKANAIIKRGKF